jgi:PAS domain S-box-containing protein
MSDAIVYADAEGVIRLWNRGATRIFGFTEAEALGRSPDIVIPERLRERHWQGYRTTMRTGQTRYRNGQMLSIPAVRKDGAQISVEFTIVPFTNDAGQMIGIAAIMRDATARFEELRALRLAADPPPTATSPGRDGTARVGRWRNDLIRPSEHPSGLGDLRNDLLTRCGHLIMAFGYGIKGRTYRLTSFV